jgi:MFS transporter, PHS family, inorganic phosphate transporter
MSGSVQGAGAVRLEERLNESRVSGFHIRALFTAGMGFVTDGYDLGVISVVLILVTTSLHATSGELALVGSTALLSSFLGAVCFGRIGDLFGRKSVYGLEAALMLVGAIASALSPNIWFLIAARFVVGLGVGGDYPISSVLMSEYANTRSRGAMVSMANVFLLLGNILGPLIAVTVLLTPLNHGIAWRLLLGLGALPALVVIWFRRRMPESPRYVAQVRGDRERAAREMEQFAGSDLGSLAAGHEGRNARRPSLRAFLTSRRLLVILLGTAGSWFLLDYYSYGGSVNQQLILRQVAPHAGVELLVVIQLAMLVAFNLTGVVTVALLVDRIGHRTVQIVGFLVVALASAVIAIVPGLTTALVPFFIAYGASNFFASGPACTTFVLPSGAFPVEHRTTGQGLSAGIAKAGAYVGALTVPLILAASGLHVVMGIVAICLAGGAVLTLCIPNTTRKSLEELQSEVRLA